jgi:hypothetical protein
MSQKHIAFTSANAWVARALFHSSFWDSFSAWGKSTMLVPPAYYPLPEVTELDGAAAQIPQEGSPFSHFFTQAWAVLLLNNGYRLGSQTRRMMQNRHIERGNALGKLIRVSQRAAARSIYRLGLGLAAEKYYWRRLSQWQITVNIRALLQAQNFDALAICGSERDVDHAYVAAAHQLGLPLAVLVRSWDNLSTKMAAVPVADGYILWSDEMARELHMIAPWIPDEQMHIVGASQFDRHRMEWVPERNTFFEAVGLDPASAGPLIMYSCGGTHLLTADEYPVQQLARLLREGVFPAGTQILVRMHPFLRRLHYVESFVKNFPHGPGIALWPPQDHTPAISDHDALIGALAYQAVNVNIASTMAIDSMIFDKPVINVAFDNGVNLYSVRSVKDFYQFDHYRTIVERGGTDIAYSPEELKQMINAAFENPSAKASQRADTVRFHVGQVDGLAGRRTAEAMHSIWKAKLNL